MNHTRRNIEAQMESQRFAASQAPREQPVRDTLSVYWTCRAYIEAGDTKRARELWREHKAELAAAQPIPMNGQDFHHFGEC